MFFYDAGNSQGIPSFEKHERLILAVDGHSGHGRPRKTWEHVIMEDLCVKGLRREVAQNRAEWRSDEQSNPCLHGIIMDLKTMMMMMMMMSLDQC